MMSVRLAGGPRADHPGERYHPGGSAGVPGDRNRGVLGARSHVGEGCEIYRACRGCIARSDFFRTAIDQPRL
jgi:hypothetical protein